VLVDQLGVPPAECTPAQLAYDLRKLRAKGVVRKVEGRPRYTLTDAGYRVAVYWTKLDQRLLTPVPGQSRDGCPARRGGLGASPRPRADAAQRQLRPRGRGGRPEIRGM